jgi:hypothetical protein
VIASARRSGHSIDRCRSISVDAQVRKARTIAHVSDLTTLEASLVTYSVLRVDSRATAPLWWRAASQRRDAPAAITALLGGRTRVEVTREEAVQALAWAAAIADWPTADPKPVFVHEPAATA